MDKLVVLNNKSNFTKDEFLKYIDELKVLKQEIVLAPSSCYLSLAADFVLASQDVSMYNGGSFTGEISASQLKSLNIKYSLVGHYERKKYFNESEDDTRVKIHNLLYNDITPILCVGDTREEYNSLQTKEILLKKLEYLLDDIDPALRSRIIISYGPFWSIGTNDIPDIDSLIDITKRIKEVYPNKLLYGGSVGVGNIKELNSNPYIDGYLIGCKSLDANNVKQILEVLNS